MLIVFLGFRDLKNTVLQLECCSPEHPGLAIDMFYFCVPDFIVASDNNTKSFAPSELEFVHSKFHRKG